MMAGAPVSPARGTSTDPLLRGAAMRDWKVSATILSMKGSRRRVLTGPGTFMRPISMIFELYSTIRSRRWKKEGVSTSGTSGKILIVDLLVSMMTCWLKSRVFRPRDS